MRFNANAAGLLPSLTLTLPILPQSTERLGAQVPASFIAQPVVLNEKTSVVAKREAGEDAEGVPIKSMIITQDNLGVKMLHCSLSPNEIAEKLPDSDLGNRIRDRIAEKAPATNYQNRLFNGH